MANYRGVRVAAHQRRIECCAYQREDGLWDLEGVLSDVKGVDHPLADRPIKAGDVLHEMHITLTVDQHFMIHAARAQTVHAPYALCQGCNPHYAELVGLSLTKGFRHRVRELLGGTKGCTHLTDLLGPLATTAFQAIGTWQHSQNVNKASARQSIDACYGLRAEGDPVRVHFPEFYRPEHLSGADDK